MRATHAHADTAPSRPESKRDSESPTRRAVLTGAGGLLASAVAGCMPGAPSDLADVSDMLAGERAGQRSNRWSPTPTPAPRPDRIAPELVALVQRLTFGVSTEELALAEALGFDGYLEHHLNYEKIDDSEVDAVLASFTTLNMSTAQLAALPPTMTGLPIQELVAARLIRATYSKRQLFERMVQFWTDHFSIDIRQENQRFFKPVDDRAVIRQHALGSFPVLLSASAHSPAMLYSLDNFNSSAALPNENYSRELMELHTLGVDGGYTQTDVEEVARCFTGWSFYLPGQRGALGTFFFNSTLHDYDGKFVLGHFIAPGGGIEDGEQVLQILANHPSTAVFICRKLARWLLDYHPSDALVGQLANIYLTTGGDLRAIIRAILTPENLLANVNAKFKQPLHLIVSALRGLNANVTDWRFLGNELNGLGNTPFYWPAPNGYPDSFEYWRGDLLNRWNLMFRMLTFAPGVTIDVFRMIMNPISDIPTMADRVDLRLYGGYMPPDEKQLLIDYLTEFGSTEPRLREGIALALAAPGFQWY